MQEQYERQTELIKWIDQKLCVEVPTANERELIALGCFDLCIEHHAAIVVLYKSGLLGAMFALLRCQYEAYVRGIFLLRSATQEEIDQFKADSFKLKFYQLIDRVEKDIGYIDSPISKLKNSSWAIFNSFTHSGYQHLTRRYKDGKAGAINYENSEIVSLFNVAGALSLLSAVSISEMAGNSSLTQEIMQKNREYCSS